MNPRLQAILLAACILAVGCRGGLDMTDAAQDASAHGPDADLTDPTGPGADAGLEPLPDAGGPTTSCLPVETFFERKVWPGVIQPICASCHVAGGPGAASSFVVSPEEPTAADFETVRRLALEGTLLTKPTGAVDHEGGVLLTTDGAAYALLQSFVDRVEDPTASCEAVEGEERPLDIVALSPRSLYRKVALSLVGRRATEAEIARLEAEGEAALAPMLDALLREEGFYQRLREGFNDILLTDGALADDDTHPAGYLDEVHYPDRMWFGGLPVDERRGPTEATGLGVTRAPLELIVHVVREGLPFSEILTADYVMMNPYAARSYGVFDAADFVDPEDPDEFRPLQLPPDPLTGEAFPTAGILSNYYYLSRYPSTATNRNRHRARMVYQHFLDTDVMDLTPERADPTEVADIPFPIRDSAQCSVCHTVVDPVAGAFQSYDDGGRRNPTPEVWYDDTFPPGFEAELLPPDASRRALPWLAARIVEDPRFVRSAAAHAYRILFAREPMERPTDPMALDFDARLVAWERQQALLKEAAAVFVDAGLDFRVLLRHLILSDDYRAMALREPPSSEAATLVAESLGSGQLATPEQLTRRLTAVLGEPWIFRYDEPFLAPERFLLLYGGIDSAAMTERIREPNALMGAIVELMANDVGCRFVGRELSLPAAERSLLAEVEAADLPSADGGSEADARIRAAVAELHVRFLREEGPEAGPEIDATVQLFADLQRAGAEAIAAGEVPVLLDHHCGKNTGGLREDPDYTVRAWAGVVSYLLQTYAFLYE